MEPRLNGGTKVRSTSGSK